ncbi:hypothetical protein P0D69_28020 [Paraburkholderia sediminicola]|uniref:hypothetical protein n=1 Tax=Paraburkholderia sediminicola TaxID=458836 RepID=UPI0038BB8503
MSSDGTTRLIFTLQADQQTLVASFGQYLPIQINSTLQSVLNDISDAQASVQSALNAATSAISASGQAQNSANNAAASAAQAQTSASSINGAVSQSQSSATAAAYSATQAQTSASAASTSAIQAQTSATSATTSATQAQTSATSATASATSATASATSASTSAAAAQAAATTAQHGVTANSYNLTLNMPATANAVVSGNLATGISNGMLVMQLTATNSYAGTVQNYGLALYDGSASGTLLYQCNGITDVTFSDTGLFFIPTLSSGNIFAQVTNIDADPMTLALTIKALGIAQ